VPIIQKQVGESDVILSKVISDCPECAAEKSFGICLVRGNCVIKGCCRCNYRITVDLPVLKKRILYLDQCFHSTQFKGTNPKIVEAGKRIEKLAYYHQIVAPFAEVHEVESLQWVQDKRDELFDFIKQTARGHRFKPESEIQKVQLCRSLKQFLKDEPVKVDLKQYDALPHDIHYWDNHCWIDTKISIEKPEETQKQKQIYADRLIDFFPKWRDEKFTFKQIFVEETGGIAQVIRTFHMMMSPLLYFIRQESRNDDAFKVLDKYLQSDHFREVPYISILAALNSKMRQKIQEGSYSNLVKARDTFMGFPYDAEFISVFGPYCDAMFIDNTMRHWLIDSDLGFEVRFNVKLFSISNFDDFINWIGELESTTPDEVRRITDEIY
jgi:hypothetical protein